MLHDNDVLANHIYELKCIISDMLDEIDSATPRERIIHDMNERYMRELNRFDEQCAQNKAKP